jgi:hypothetical protein
VLWFGVEQAVPRDFPILHQSHYEEDMLSHESGDVDADARRWVIEKSLETFPY